MIALGYENDALPAAELVSAAQGVRASWTRIISTPGAELEPIAERIRAAHAAGLRVILTVGGTGTSDRRPDVTVTLRWVESLPQVERYTWTNEPDQVGMSACAYGRGWRRLRRVLGSRLLFGDLSPYVGVRFTLRAARCAHLRGALDLAIHPYDHLSWVPGLAGAETAMPRLRWAAGVLRHQGLHARWWITEFGYAAADSWRWPFALRRARRAGARVVVAYDVLGPTWNTKLDEPAKAALRAA